MVLHIETAAVDYRVISDYLEILFLGFIVAVIATQAPHDTGHALH